jgi:hypothetical protein
METRVIYFKKLRVAIFGCGVKFFFYDLAQRLFGVLPFYF